MAQGMITIGIIAKYFEGSLNGRILAGIYSVLKQHQARIIAIRTMYVNRPNYPLYDFPLADEAVDGWIMLNEVVSDSFVERHHRLGKPMVSVNRLIEQPSCTSVLADNKSGMYMSTEHLIRHGHRNIAFIGDLANPNMQIRLDGYKQALSDYGVALDDRLIIDTKNFNYVGGYNVAELLMPHIHDCTAVVAATDMNAEGVMERLREAGVSIPDGVAIVGFNDSRFAGMSDPPLSTVYHPAFEMGEKAAHAILQKLSGASDIPSVYMVPCTLVVRKSCGCDCDESPSPSEIHTDREKTDLNVDYLLHMTENYNDMGANLMRTHSIDMKELSWISKMKWGCLAYWRIDGSSRLMLAVDQYFDENLQVPSIAGQQYRAEQFPPEHLFVSDPGEPPIININLIRTHERDWGIMAFGGFAAFGDFRSRLSVNMMSHLMDSFAAILDREEMLKEIRQQKNEYQTMAEQLRTITNTTSDGIWIWNLNTGRFHWYNDRIQQILGSGARVTIPTFYDFYRLVHPEDAERVRDVFEKHCRTFEPFDMELRMRRSDGTYLWVNIAGELMAGGGNDDMKMVGLIRDITETKQAEERIKYLAYHDVLTGLPNRQLFHERLHEAITVARANGHKLALLLLDLDRFKMINDTYGHQAGDDLLLFVSQKMKALIRDGMTISRIGGDEFLIFLPAISGRQEAVGFGDQILDVLRTSYRHGKFDFHVTGSLGISIYPDDGLDMTTLIKNADIAMYRAKMKGKNQLELFSEDMNVYTAELLNLENGLRKAVSRGEFELFYQPQTDVQTGKLHGVEALIRWQSPERGYVPPSDFIPLAEDTGLIVPIGNWVLREACRQMKDWLDRGYPRMKLSVNISGKQLEESEFLPQVRVILAETGLDPSLLCFEITESMAIKGLDSCLPVLREMNRLGIGISMDDFGTGYSSLALLKDLPIQYVKIDKSFIDSILTKPSDSAIVNGIIYLSHNLNIEVTAEGVETEAQLDLLRRQGCDYYQGYLDSKPLPAAEMEWLLRSRAT